MNENRELVDSVSNYIVSVYNEITEVLKGVYTYEGIELEKIQNIGVNIGNIIEYVDAIGKIYSIKFEFETITMGIKNVKEALHTNNYLLLCDTFEYEIVVPISEYYDIISKL